MKKLASVVLLFSLLMPICAAEVSWSPSLSVYGGWQGDKFASSLDSSLSLVSTGFVEGRVDPLSITIGRHSISLPVNVSYASSGMITTRTMKSSELDFGLELEYGVRITDIFALSLGGGFRLHDFFKQKGWYVSYGGTLIPSFVLLDFIYLDIPVSAYFGKNGWNIRTGVGVTFIYGGPKA